MDISGFNKYLSNFEWSGKNSLSFGVALTSAAPHNLPERDTTSVSIAGRSGDLLKDNGRYKNMPVSYSCSIVPLPRYSNCEEQMRDIKQWLYSTGVNYYATLSDTFNPNMFRLAKVKAISPVKSGLVYTFTLNFDCHPQLYYTEGDNWLDFSGKTVKLINPSNHTALPKIVISGNNSTTTLSDKITIDSAVYSFSAWTGSNSINNNNYKNDVYLDAEIMDAYLSDGTPINKFLLADSRTPTEFIKLGAGEHTISHNGDCTVKIQPRWWTI